MKSKHREKDHHSSLNEAVVIVLCECKWVCVCVIKIEGKTKQKEAPQYLLHQKEVTNQNQREETPNKKGSVEVGGTNQFAFSLLFVTERAVFVVLVVFELSQCLQLVQTGPTS